VKCGYHHLRKHPYVYMYYFFNAFLMCSKNCVLSRIAMLYTIPKTLARGGVSILKVVASWCHFTIYIIQGLSCIPINQYKHSCKTCMYFFSSLFFDLLVRWLETIFNPNGGLVMITMVASQGVIFFGPNVPPQQIANLLQTKQQRTQTPILGQGASNFSSLQKNQRAWILWHERRRSQNDGKTIQI